MDISHRKVKKKIQVKGPDGKALANTKIRIKQTNHEFLFGCGAFDFIPYTCKDIIPEEMKKNFDEAMLNDAVEKWLSVFNYGTIPFYWGAYEPTEGNVQKESRMKAAEYLNSKNVTVKGHPLCWHTVCADWLMKYDNKTIMQKQLDRIEREVVGFKGVVDMWDVINEVVIMPVFDKYDNAVTRICNEYGQVELVKKVFEKARECNPNATLLINDFNTSKAYEDLIERILDAGVEISAIGIQSHQHQGYWGEEKTLDVLERFSRFKLPIHFTENTLVSGTLIPEYIEDLNDWQVPEWPTTPEGEARQAKEMEEMYRNLFANPYVKAITTWDFKDGAWLGAPSGFLRKDNSVKPSYEMMKDLVKKEWWTDETLSTDEAGYVEVEAFKGDYELIVGNSKADIKLTDDGSEISVSIKM